MSKPPVPSYHIRTIETPEELALVVELQRNVWPGSDVEIAPAHVLLAAGHSGGLVAGAFIGDCLAGFVFGFLGFSGQGRALGLKHCSHMLGIHPEYRNAGIGTALKRYQRDFALSQGLDLITWTYDPLLARNAQLNIAKLGAVSNTYLVNLYGDLTDGLNKGLPTDRLQVDWWINTPWVADHVSGAPAPRPCLAASALALNPPDDSGNPPPPTAPTSHGPLTAAILLDLPADFQALKSADRDLALRWRLGMRAALQALFQQGYVISDFLYEPGPAPRATYIITRALPRSTEVIT